jgi:probable rRNA maturation factor
LNWNSIYHKLKIGLKNTRLLKEKIDSGKVRKLVKEIIRKENSTLGEIEIVFLKDDEILKINSKHLGHNYFTDVITFSYNKKFIINGDIFVSVDTVDRNAAAYHVLFSLEVIRVIIHGVLHLIGYNDQNLPDKGIMKEKENLYLKKWEEHKL